MGALVRSSQGHLTTTPCREAGPAITGLKVVAGRWQPRGRLKRQSCMQGEELASVMFTRARTARVLVARDRRVVSVEALFERRYRPLCRLAGFMVGDRDIAEQIVQEAFLEIYVRWGTIRDDSRAEAYLRRSVVNGANSALRRRSLEARANALALSRSERVVQDEYGCIPDPDVLQAVRRLPDRQRAAVVLYFYEDLSEAQIAETLRCSVGTVKSQLWKARARLAQSLGDRADQRRNT
jgi:RNA polymerase sigma-70 factor (sigma-E family)